LRFDLSLEGDPMTRTIVLATLLLSGCASFVTINGTRYYDFQVKELDGVARRAEFETGCAAEDISLTPIGEGPWIDQVGVIDCHGRRLVYVETPAGYILNSSDAKSSKE